MSWEMQVEVMNHETGKREFQSVCCSGKDGYTYRYKTKLEAQQSLKSCYPCVMNDKLRVIEVDAPANIGHK